MEKYIYVYRLWNFLMKKTGGFVDSDWHWSDPSDKGMIARSDWNSIMIAFPDYFLTRHFSTTLLVLAIKNIGWLTLRLWISIRWIYMHNFISFGCSLIHIFQALSIRRWFQFFFFVLAPTFFIFSFVCNLMVLSSIVRRQSKTTRKQIGRTLNPRQLQHQKGIVYTYILQAFMPLVLATPYYIASKSFACLAIYLSFSLP